TRFSTFRLTGEWFSILRKRTRIPEVRYGLARIHYTFQPLTYIVGNGGKVGLFLKEKNRQNNDGKKQQEKRQHEDFDPGQFPYAHAPDVELSRPSKDNRLRWLGHIWGSPENNQIRAYTFKNPMGSRTRGRPPTRWIDDVENVLKTLNIKNWQRVAAYRWNWRKRAVEAAKTCNRLLRL
ncbi:endonuclease-reverse transcriptase, partial [Trichonephila clavipes]